MGDEMDDCRPSGRPLLLSHSSAAGLGFRNCSPTLVGARVGLRPTLGQNIYV